MRIIIIRHAEPDYENNTLTQKGFREADLLGKYYKDLKFDSVYVSSLPRAIYTADGLLRYNSNKKYEICDWLREMDGIYRDGQIRCAWDFPVELLDNNNFFDLNNWNDFSEVNKQILNKRNVELINKLDEIFENNGYKRNGLYYDVKESNHKTICFVCHFGLESYVLAHLMNISPIVVSNFTVSRPSGVTILHSEERSKGKAIFRLCEYGSVYHLLAGGEKPSFMARKDECFGDDGEYER